MLNPTQTPGKRLPRYRRAARPLAHLLSKRDQDILEALNIYPFMTALQLSRLVFQGESSLSYCRERLKELYHAHLVDRLYLPRAPHGSPLTIYTPKRRNPTQRSLYFLEHSLSIIDFMLAVCSLSQTEHLQLSKVILEGELRKHPVKVNDGKREVAVIPDCYLKLILHTKAPNQSYELAWCLELDRASMPSQAFRKKISRYLAFAQGPYQKAYGTTAITVVIITTAGKKRLTSLTQAVEHELIKLGQTSQADLFRLASADPAQENPKDLFEKPRFHIPFRKEPVSLIPEL